jgi:hypothetical protein
MQPMTRRTFIGFAAGVAVTSAGAIAYKVLHTDGEEDARDDERPRLDASDTALQHALADPAAAARIGAVYVAQRPAPKSASPTYVFPPTDPKSFPGGAAQLEHMSAADTATIVRNAAHRDCFAGEWVQLDGWLLPKTIADLCAVAHTRLV